MSALRMPALGIQNTARVTEVDTMEVLLRNIERLRATVARLREAGFNPPYRVHSPGPAEF